MGLVSIEQPMAVCLMLHDILVTGKGAAVSLKDSTSPHESYLDEL